MASRPQFQSGFVNFQWLNSRLHQVIGRGEIPTLRITKEANKKLTHYRHSETSELVGDALSGDPLQRLVRRPSHSSRFTALPSCQSQRHGNTTFSSDTTNTSDSFPTASWICRHTSSRTNNVKRYFQPANDSDIEDMWRRSGVKYRLSFSLMRDRRLRGSALVVTSTT